MSALAFAFVAPDSCLEALAKTSRPVRRFLRRPLDPFPQFVAQHCKAIPPFQGSGFVFATLLAMLADRGVDLLAAGDTPLAHQLRIDRGAMLVLALSSADRRGLADDIGKLAVSESEMVAFHEELTETSEAEIGALLVSAFAYLLHALRHVPEHGTLLFVLA